MSFGAKYSILIGLATSRGSFTISLTLFWSIAPAETDTCFRHLHCRMWVLSYFPYLIIFSFSKTNLLKISIAILFQ
jgi:hypothetical protein